MDTAVPDLVPNPAIHTMDTLRLPETQAQNGIFSEAQTVANRPSLGTGGQWHIRRKSVTPFPLNLRLLRYHICGAFGHF